MIFTNRRSKNALNYCGYPAFPLSAGLASSYTMGGFIHILLVIAIVVIVVRIIQGRRM